MRDAGMMRVAGGPRSSSPLLLVRWNLASTVMFVRHSRKQGGTTSRKKNLPHCTPDARHATRRRGDAPSLDEAPRVPAGKPVGPGSGRWLGRVDPTAIGVVNGVVGSRDSVSFSRAGLIQVVGFFFWSAGGKPPSENHPPLSSPFGRPGGSKGVACLFDAESELSVKSARREITPRFRVHRRETGPRPSAWRTRPTRESKNRSCAPRFDGVSCATRARVLCTRALDFGSGLRVTVSVG